MQSFRYYHDGKTPDFKQYSPNRRGRRRNQMQLICIGNYVGVHYDVKSANDDFEIYDVVNDPKEKNNLMTEPVKAENSIEGRKIINTKVLSKGKTFIEFEWSGPGLKKIIPDRVFFRDR